MEQSAREVFAFGWAVLTYWQGLVTGGVIPALLEVGQRLFSWRIQRRHYLWLFIVVYLLTAFFLAWRDEHRRAITVGELEAKLKTAGEQLKTPLRWVSYDSIRRAGEDYSTRVTITTLMRIEPTRLRIEFDGPVEGNVQVYLLGSSSSNEWPYAANVEGQPNVIEVSFQRPPFTPETPLSFDTYSLQPVRIIRVLPLPYVAPRR